MEGLTSVYLTTQVACLKECTSLNAVKPGTSELKAYKETFQLSRDTILTAQPLAVKTQAPGDPHSLVPGAAALLDAGANEWFMLAQLREARPLAET